MLDPTTVEIGVCIHDGVYSIDFCVHKIQLQPSEPVAATLKANVLDTIQKYSYEHHGKFVGCGITEDLHRLCPDLCSFLWSELDIVVMKFKVKAEAPMYSFTEDPENAAAGIMVMRDVDEQADSAARKCVRYFGPGHNPVLSIGFRNKVEPDIGGKAELVSRLESYRETVHEGTWNSVLKYAKELKKGNTKVAFFSATPQGGGVALMRHALIRFYRLLGVNVQWFVDNPLFVGGTWTVAEVVKYVYVGTSRSRIRKSSESQKRTTTSSKASPTPRRDSTKSDRPK